MSKTKRLTVRERVEQIVATNGYTYLEALSFFMQENSLSEKRIAKSICPTLFKKLQAELRITRVVQTEVLDRFYTDGKIKMTKQQAIEWGKRIQDLIDTKEAIINVIREKKKRARDAGMEREEDSEILVYEIGLEEELEILLELSNFCSIVAGE